MDVSASARTSVDRLDSSRGRVRVLVYLILLYILSCGITEWIKNHYILLGPLRILKMDESASILRFEAAPKSSAELITHAYKTAWTEYFSWSLRYSAATLDSLAAQNKKPECNSFMDRDHRNLYVAQVSNDNEQFLVTYFSKEEDTPTELLTVAVDSVCLDRPFRPHAPYESCTPISRNLMVGDDPDDLPFIFFSDDPSYDYYVDIEEYKYFRWQLPNLKHNEDCNVYY